MKDSTNNDALETHQHFPSGEWEGFYTYHTNGPGKKHYMYFNLEFKNQIVIGEGLDDVDPFTWKGKYSLTAKTCDMLKSYPYHSVMYNGNVDESGIWGIWTLDNWQGGFHLWPIKRKAEQRAEEVNVEELLAEIFETEEVRIPKGLLLDCLLTSQIRA
ncbi:MAG: hypothetical protein AAFN93_09745 [Bacteroidota bacterium]